MTTKPAYYKPVYFFSFLFIIRGHYHCIAWPYRLTVRTPAFQAVNRGSIPRRVTIVEGSRKYS